MPPPPPWRLPLCKIALVRRQFPQWSGGDWWLWASYYSFSHVRAKISKPTFTPFPFDSWHCVGVLRFCQNIVINNIRRSYYLQICLERITLENWISLVWLLCLALPFWPSVEIIPFCVVSLEHKRRDTPYLLQLRHQPPKWAAFDDVISRWTYRSNIKECPLSLILG